MPVVLTRRAARQVEDAARWWATNRTAAPNAVREDLQAAVVLVAEQPMCGTPVVHRKHHGLRRVHLARIGYHLYYRLSPRLRQVQVVAFWHAHRGTPPPL